MSNPVRVTLLLAGGEPDVVRLLKRLLKHLGRMYRVRCLGIALEAAK